MTLDSLQSLYIHELQDLYSAEKQLVRALPKLAKAAGSPELKSAFTTHLAQTKEHVRRLEQLLLGLGEEPGAKKCKGMAGLIKEGQDLIKEGGEPAVLDGGLITAAQKVEHYEISAYGTARTMAGQIGRPDIAQLLGKTLAEEQVADSLLTQIARELMAQSRTGVTKEETLAGERDA
jgi:ferritin-like metal-binding protein YciE